MPLLVPSIKGGEFLSSEWAAAEAKGASMDYDALVMTLKSQAALYAELVSAMSDDDLRGEVDIFGMKLTRGTMLVNLLLCGHSAYRMQLFCYLKACGREELNTMNLWKGVDGLM
jgi:hypothetical protein